MTFPKSKLLVAGLTGALWLAPALCAAVVPPPAPSEVRKLFDAGSYSSAASSLKSATSAEPNNPALHYWLGRCFYEMHDYSNAVSSFERAVALDPDLSPYHDWLGRASGLKALADAHGIAKLSALGLARRAEHEFSDAVRLDPANVDAQRDLIRFLIYAPPIAGGSQERAQMQIKDLAPIDPVQADLAAAESLAKRMQFDEAGQKYEQILQSKPHSVDVDLEIADYYSERGDVSHLQQATDAAAQIAPRDHRLLFYRGVALVLSKQDTARAEEDLRDYLSAVPDNSDDPSHALAHDWLGKLFADQGKVDAAISQYGAELALDPHNKAAHEALDRLKKQR